MKKYNKLIIISLGVLAGIATYGVINAINTSKDKAEDAFLNEIGKQIEMYIDLNSFAKNREKKEFHFNKVISSTNNGTSGSLVTRPVTAWEMENDNNYVTLDKLLAQELTDKDIFENPKNKKKCKNLENIKIHVYMDTDFAYYYFVSLEDAECLDNKKIINTLPKELICQISDLKEKYNAAPNIDDEDKCTE